MSLVWVSECVNVCVWMCVCVFLLRLSFREAPDPQLVCSEPSLGRLIVDQPIRWEVWQRVSGYAADPKLKHIFISWWLQSYIFTSVF